jgi:hypothetical protein
MESDCSGRLPVLGWTQPDEIGARYSCFKFSAYGQQASAVGSNPENRVYNPTGDKFKTKPMKRTANAFGWTGLGCGRGVTWKPQIFETEKCTIKFCRKPTINENSSDPTPMLKAVLKGVRLRAVCFADKPHPYAGG